MLSEMSISPKSIGNILGISQVVGVAEPINAVAQDSIEVQDACRDHLKSRGYHLVTSQ